MLYQLVVTLCPFCCTLATLHLTINSGIFVAIRVSVINYYKITVLRVGQILGGWQLMTVR